MNYFENKPVLRAFSLQSFYTALDFEWTDSFSYEGEQHDFWEIVYVMSGSVDATENERVYNLSEGQMIIHAPMEFHKIRTVDSAAHVLILTFSASGELPSNLTDGIFLISAEMRTVFHNLFYQAKQFVENPSENMLLGQEAIDRLSAFLLRLSRRYTAQSHLVNSRSAAEYARLVDLMNESVYENLTAQDFAKMGNISLSYMKQLFSRYAGIGPKAYFARLRCTEASRLLQTGKSATEVAQMMNFSSPNYFSSFFKRMTGTPPVRHAHIKSEQVVQEI